LPSHQKGQACTLHDFRHLSKPDNNLWYFKGSWNEKTSTLTSLHPFNGLKDVEIHPKLLNMS
jgi:hypothetical protein